MNADQIAFGLKDPRRAIGGPFVIKEDWRPLGSGLE